MQNIVIEKPYRFVPPHRGRFWHALFGLYLPHYLNRNHGITSVECRGTELLRRSLDAGQLPDVPEGMVWAELGVSSAAAD
jgi:hypothetical protein